VNWRILPPDTFFAIHPVFVPSVRKTLEFRGSGCSPQQSGKTQNQPGHEQNAAANGGQKIARTLKSERNEAGLEVPSPLIGTTMTREPLTSTIPGWNRTDEGKQHDDFRQYPPRLRLNPLATPRLRETPGLL